MNTTTQTKTQWKHHLKPFHFLGILLLVLYIISDIAHYRPAFLLALQHQGQFKIYSGFIFGAIIASQWLLLLVRISPERYEHYHLKIYNYHNWSGALMPLFFFIHAGYETYNYLFALTIIFFLNILLGLIPPTWSAQNLGFKKVWLFAHILVSILLLTGILLHFFTIFYYE